MKFTPEQQEALRLAEGPEWWHAEALGAIILGSFRIVRARSTNEPYLLRCWLTPERPAMTPDGHPESASSLLLHRLIGPDDDPHMHDHPWTFRSTVLSGYYHEQRPSSGTLVRRTGTTATRQAHEYHRVAGVSSFEQTWTLVRVGERQKDWSFLVDGQPIPWKKHLQIGTTP